MGTSPPPLSRPTTLPSPSSRTSPPTEPRPSLDQSVLTRLSTSQLSTRPAPTPSRLSPRLLPPPSTLSPMSQLLLMLPLPQLPLPKQRPKSSSVPKSETERGLYHVPCAVSDFLRHTRLYNRKVGVSWWLFLVFLRTAS